MDLDSILKFLHLEPKVEIDAEGNQIGIVNVKKENSDNISGGIHVHLPSDPETARAFVRELISPEILKRAKEETRRELDREPFRTLINTLSPSTQEEVIAKSVGLSAVDEIGFRENVTSQFVTEGPKKKEE
jgi:hypothetical protein